MQNTTTAFHHDSPLLSRPHSGDNPAFKDAQKEHFVDANALAEHLSVKRRQILEMTRRGIIPGYPLGVGKSRMVWRYKISEVEAAIASGVLKPLSCQKDRALADATMRRTMPIGSPRSRKEKSNG